MFQCILLKLLCLYLCISKTFARAECDTRSFSLQTLTDLNSVFLLSDWLP